MKRSNIKRPLRLGVVGATGMVGQAFMKILSEQHVPIAELRPFASENSLGKSVKLGDQTYPIQILKSGCFEALDVVFFSSGDETSKEWAPRAVESGAYAIDNSAAFRMDPGVKLIVPEVNGHLLVGDQRPQIIANPNCSTIQLVVALHPLAKAFGLEEVRVSSYQAVSGAGQAAFDELLRQVRSQESTGHQGQNFPHQILFNLIPQIGSFGDHGFCSEEIKIIKETKKILDAPQLKVSAFTVRVPVLNAHSEAVWVTLSKTVEQNEFKGVLEKTEGLMVLDNPRDNQYPMPLSVSGTDPVYVGRIHRDLENSKLWLMWVVADNIRKGAALNGMQIAEKIFG